MTAAVDIPPRRSILKKSPTPTPLSMSPKNHSPPGVHFPPSPCVTRTFEMHSSTIYDRSPIVVGPNNCALPDRGCPGRTYYKVDDEDDPDETSFCTRFLRLAENRESSRGQHAHPRALELLDSSNIIPPLPLLIPDLSTASSSSSESEESDGFISPAPESVSSLLLKPPPLSPAYDTCTALFPPEPPAHPALLSSFSVAERVVTAFSAVVVAETRSSFPIQCPPPRFKGRRSRSSSPPDDVDEDPGYVEDNERIDEERTPTSTRRFSLSPPRLQQQHQHQQSLSTSPPSSSLNKKKKSCKVSTVLRSQLCKNLSFRSEEDDGCLGGF